MSSKRRRETGPIAVVLLSCCLASVAFAAPPKPARPSETAQLSQQLADLLEAQRRLEAEIAALREQMQSIGPRFGELDEQLRAEREAVGNDRELLKAMREEVRGLYVESSSTKELVNAAGERVDALGGSLERFRFSAGVLMAVLLGLQIIGIMLAFRKG